VLIHEPTAAAIAYAHKKKLTNLENLLVFDFGGGTLDITIVDIMKNGNIKIIGTHGNTHLGGIDFTNNLLNYSLTNVDPL
jgi:molecular chaperone DnaK (HSP70)